MRERRRMKSWVKERNEELGGQKIRSNVTLTMES